MRKVLDRLLKNVQSYNSNANWVNLMAGVGLLAALVWGSMWLFGRKEETPVFEGGVGGITSETENLNESEGPDEDSVMGVNSPGIEVLPTTSSK